MAALATAQRRAEALADGIVPLGNTSDVSDAEEDLNLSGFGSSFNAANSFSSSFRSPSSTNSGGGSNHGSGPRIKERRDSVFDGFDDPSIVVFPRSAAQPSSTPENPVLRSRKGRSNNVKIDKIVIVGDQDNNHHADDDARPTSLLLSPTIHNFKVKDTGYLDSGVVDDSSDGYLYTYSKGKERQNSVYHVPQDSLYLSKGEISSPPPNTRSSSRSSRSVRPGSVNTGYAVPEPLAAAEAAQQLLRDLYGSTGRSGSRRASETLQPRSQSHGSSYGGFVEADSSPPTGQNNVNDVVDESPYSEVGSSNKGSTPTNVGLLARRGMDNFDLTEPYSRIPADVIRAREDVLHEEQHTDSSDSDYLIDAAGRRIHFQEPEQTSRRKFSLFSSRSKSAPDREVLSDSSTPPMSPLNGRRYNDITGRGQLTPTSPAVGRRANAMLQSFQSVSPSMSAIQSPPPKSPGSPRTKGFAAKFGKPSNRDPTPTTVSMDRVNQVYHEIRGLSDANPEPTTPKISSPLSPRRTASPLHSPTINDNESSTIDALLQLTHAGATGQLSDSEVVNAVRNQLEQMRKNGDQLSASPPGMKSKDFELPAAESLVLKAEATAGANPDMEIPNDLEGLVPTTEKGLLKLAKLYALRRDAVLSGKQPCTQEVLCKLAAYQLQIEFGTHLRQGVIDTRTVLPTGWARQKGLEEKIWLEKSNLEKESDACLQYRYMMLCRTMPTYGGISFPVQEKIRGKTKKLPRLICLKLEKLLVLDIVTLEILYERDMSTLRRWKAVGEAVMFSFMPGGYDEEQLVFISKQSASVADVIVKIIGKRGNTKSPISSGLTSPVNGSPSPIRSNLTSKFARRTGSTGALPDTPHSPLSQSPMSHSPLSPGSPLSPRSQLRSPASTSAVNSHSKFDLAGIGKALKWHHTKTILEGQPNAKATRSSERSKSPTVSPPKSQTFSEESSLTKIAPQASFSALFAVANQQREKANDRAEAYRAEPTSPEIVAATTASPYDDKETDEIWGGTRQSFSGPSGADPNLESGKGSFAVLYNEIKRARKTAAAASASMSSELEGIALQPDLNWQQQTRMSSATHIARHSNTICEALEAIGDDCVRELGNKRNNGVIDFGMLASWVGTIAQHTLPLAKNLRLGAALGFGSENSKKKLIIGQHVFFNIKAVLKHLYFILKKTNMSDNDAVRSAVQTFLEQANSIAHAFERLNMDEPGTMVQMPQKRDRFSGFVESEEGIYDTTPAQARPGFVVDSRQLGSDDSDSMDES